MDNYQAVIDTDPVIRPNNWDGVQTEVIRQAEYKTLQ